MRFGDVSSGMSRCFLARSGVGVVRSGEVWQGYLFVVAVIYEQVRSGLVE